MSNQLRRHRALLALALIGNLGLATAYWHTQAVGQEKSSPSIQPKQVHQAEQLSSAFRHAAEVAMPSVVTVRSVTKAHPVNLPKGQKGRPSPFNKDQNPFKGTPFEDFFGGDMRNMIPDQMPRREGMGSGVIVDAAGIVLTNNHVVDGADKVVVQLSDGREFTAIDIKTDPQSDLAVLRLKGASSLPVARLGNSDSLEIGDWVLAIGNPFELEQTVSAGIISGKGRELGSIDRAKFLQTDAAINPGNSGGPLVNLEGEVIGINTAIATNNGSFQGVGFANPINQAKWVMTQLIGKGSVERAYLGVQIDTDKDVAKYLGAENGKGVVVEEVLPSSPAADAGVLAGDVIVEFGGQKVHSRPQLKELVERVPLDSHQKLTVIRERKRETLDFVAKALPKSKDFTPSHSRSLSNDETDKNVANTYESEKLGMTVSDISTEQAEALGFGDQGGVLITNVEPDSLAAEQGLKAGMVLMQVGMSKKPIKNVEDFQAALKDQSLSEGVLLRVRAKAGNQVISRFVVLRESD